MRFENSKNGGNARITGPCGDTMEFWISVSDGKITDAKYTTDGCFSSNQCGSLTALKAAGKTLIDAEKISPEEILSAIKGISEESEHCAVLAVHTLKASIADWRMKNHSLIKLGIKKEASARSILNPKPQIIVSCRDTDGRDNALVVVYACNCSYDPPSLMVGIVPSRYSYHIIKETGCFVVNIATLEQKDLYDYMGSHSGSKEDKFAVSAVKSETGKKVNAPILTDCPVNIECTVTGSINAGSHEMFIGKIEYVHADTELLDEKGAVDWKKMRLL